MTNGGSGTDLTIAVSEDSFAETFAAFRDTFEFTATDTVEEEALTAGYEVDIELRDGSVDLRSPDEIRVEELEVFFRTLRAFAGVDIEPVPIGGFCIIPRAFRDGCAVRAPSKRLFTDDPDIGIELDLGDFLTSEATFTARPTVEYAENHPPSVSYLDAQEASPPTVNEWEMHVDPDEVDVDLIDVADTDAVERLVEGAIADEIDRILRPVPPILREIAERLLRPVIDLFREVIGLVDDIQEWLSDLLGVTLGLFNTIAEAVADLLLTEPLFTIEDPYPVIDAPASSPLIPVKVPITDLSVSVSDTELVVTSEIGDAP